MSAEIIVTVIEHPAGCLMRIEHEGASITLDRDEAYQLYEKLNEKIGQMPSKL